MNIISYYTKKMLYTYNIKSFTQTFNYNSLHMIDLFVNF